MVISTYDYEELRSFSKHGRVSKSFTESLCEQGAFGISGLEKLTHLNHNLEASARDFFLMPDNKKLSIAKSSRSGYRRRTQVGYTAHEPTVRAYKEIYDILPELEYFRDSQVWPDFLPELQYNARQYQSTQKEIEIEILAALSICLGQVAGVNLDQGYLARTIDPHGTLLRINYYPIVDFSPASDEKRDGAHKDWSSITLLYSNKPGLSFHNGEKWSPAPIIPDGLIVNVGELLEEISCGFFVAAMHQVELGDCTTSDRLSIVSFGAEAYNGSDTKKISQLVKRPGKDGLNADFSVKDFMESRFLKQHY